jgi:hypothetical protein
MKKRVYCPSKNGRWRAADDLKIAAESSSEKKCVRFIFILDKERYI